MVEEQIIGVRDRPNKEVIVLRIRFYMMAYVTDMSKACRLGLQKLQQHIPRRRTKNRSSGIYQGKRQRAARSRQPEFPVASNVCLSSDRPRKQGYARGEGHTHGNRWQRHLHLQIRCDPGVTRTRVDTM
ncbi:uncharacterized protein LOC122532660 [Frieseomelitta varia]|uniref:uncharacterized protein LOC122532660 n=1 Tax=Frieseomelitta varia TaxID=561572 RepID=UPI001CB6A8B4|nr:uncharacterized protein LOC122532660 [Frieseomelitta varia]